MIRTAITPRSFTSNSSSSWCGFLASHRALSPRLRAYDRAAGCTSPAFASSAAVDWHLDGGVGAGAEQVRNVLERG